MSYIIEHTRLGFCWLDIVALIVLLVVVIWFMVKRHDMWSDLHILFKVSGICYRLHGRKCHVL